MNPSSPLHRSAIACALSTAPLLAQASCGSSFCTLLNDRFALGTWDDLGWSVDLRVDALQADRLRFGTHGISPAEAAARGEEAVERRTRQLDVVTTVEYAFDSQWSAALRAPLVRRDHLHDLVDEESGAIGASERWRYTRVGDTLALLRWQQAPDAQQDLRWSFASGLKLPTGSTTIANADGARAERSLQPGTGTTDLSLGASMRMLLGMADALNAQATWTAPLNSHDGYKPGQRLELSAGWVHAVSPSWSTVLQVNAVQRGRDQGAEAEPENSGSTTVMLSPGVSVSLGRHDTTYAYVQVPLLQDVNGVQLMPRAAFALGWTHLF